MTMETSSQAYVLDLLIKGGPPRSLEVNHGSRVVRNLSNTPTQHGAKYDQQKCSVERGSIISYCIFTFYNILQNNININGNIVIYCKCDKN